MTENNLGERVKKIFDLLSDLEDEERDRLLLSVLSLFGKNNLKLAAKGEHSQAVLDDENIDSQTAKDFFSSKNPQNKAESLAVATRYLEITKKSDTVTKTDLELIFKDARRGFDSKNFVRDIKNAALQSKFFLTGEAKNHYKLSFFGQEYIDLMPDREAIKHLKKPGNAKKKSVGKKEKVNDPE